MLQIPDLFTFLMLHGYTAMGHSSFFNEIYTAKVLRGSEKSPELWDEVEAITTWLRYLLLFLVQARAIHTELAGL